MAERVASEIKSPVHPYDPERTKDFLKEELKRLSEIVGDPEVSEKLRVTYKVLMIQLD